MAHDENAEAGTGAGNKTETSPLAVALRDEVMRLCKEGDEKRGGAFTVELCARIERIVRAGRSLLLAERASVSDIKNLLRSASRPGRSRRSDRMTIQELCTAYDEAELPNVVTKIGRTLEEQAADWGKLATARHALDEHVKTVQDRAIRSAVEGALPGYWNAELLYFLTWHVLRGGWKAFAR